MDVWKRRPAALRTVLLAGAAIGSLLGGAQAQQSSADSAQTNGAPQQVAANTQAAPDTQVAANTQVAAASTLVGNSAAETVVVTGLRGDQRRTLADSPVPIDVVASAALELNGRGSLKEAFQTVIPSFNLPGVNGGGTSWAVRATTIRGLNGDQVLYLVNGKRRHTTSLINNLARIGTGGVPVDLDLIPVAAIDHVEVLRDGAAAQYGSDAIGGVINIILKDGTDGGVSNTTLGQNFAGDGPSLHEAADYGLELPHGGFVHFALDARASQPWYRNGPVTTPNLYNLLSNGSVDPRNATIDRYNFGKSYGGADDKLISASWNAELPINPDITLYSDATGAHRYTLKNTGSFLPSNSDSLPEVYPNGFRAFRIINEYDYQATVGARGALEGWNWDLSSSLSQDLANLDGRNTINATLGPTSPTAFHLSKQTYQQLTDTLDVTRPFQTGIFQSFNASFGFEHRYEWYAIGAGDPAAYAIGTYTPPVGQPHAGQLPAIGLASYQAASPADAGSTSRNNYAAYIDLAADVTDNWYVGIAGRGEHYTGAPGDSLSGKITTRYEFLPGYAVRATVSNGFRAPSLAQDIFATSTISGNFNPVTGVNDIFGLKVLPVNRPEAVALGAVPLKPEKSWDYSVGLTAQPIANLNLTADIYEIDIRDRITLSGTIGGAPGTVVQNKVNAILAANGLAAGTQVQYFTNALSTRTQGLDLVGDYALDLDTLGSLSLTGAYSWNQTQITRINPTPAVLQGVGVSLIGYQRAGDLTVASPKSKLIFTQDWSLEDFNVHLQQTRYGEYTERGLVQGDGTTRTFSPKWIANVAVSYNLSEKTRVTLGADNLFDVYPDKIGLYDANSGMNAYGNFSPFGISGGFYYTQLTLKLGAL